jgi:hypothetical protein
MLKEDVTEMSLYILYHLLAFIEYRFISIISIALPMKTLREVKSKQKQINPKRQPLDGIKNAVLSPSSSLQVRKPGTYNRTPLPRRLQILQRHRQRVFPYPFALRIIALGKGHRCTERISIGHEAVEFGDEDVSFGWTLAWDGFAVKAGAVGTAGDLLAAFNAKVRD